MRQASVGFHCPECSKSGRQKVYSARTLVTKPYATMALMAINVVVFVIDIASGSGGGVADMNEVAADGSLFGPAVAAGDWWRPITSGFIHYGLIHIGFNMLLLYQLGLLLEPALGRVRFLILYFTALLGGSALVLVMSYDTVTAGASGAVFGLMGASVVGLRSRGIDPFHTGIPQLLGINLVITLVFSRYISVGGHIGGLVAGLVAGWILFEGAPRLPAGKYLAPALCVAIAAGLYGACLYLGDNPI
jgi:membrane associated rhomboid family serine protease